MALKTLQSDNARATRQLVLVDRSELYKGKPVKALTEGLTKSGGRNNHGRITARFLGGGHKRTYRIIDFKRRKCDMPATVERLEYDPNRTAFIALIKYDDGELTYIIAPQRLAAGDKVIAGESGRREAGQRDAAAADAGRHDHPQRRAEARQGRPDRPFGRRLRPARRPRPGLCAILRLNSGEQRIVHGTLHGHGRRGVEPGPRQHQSRQGRPHASGSASARTFAASP